MKTRLTYLAIAMLGWTVAPASHEIPAPQRALGARAATPPCGPALDIKNAARDSRCFELRIYAYRDAAARDSAWAAFNADPEWVKTRTEMQVSVDVENTFMVATDYSPLK